ncbi:MAG TPA: hypothetical protein VIZ28_16215 [Chitinophagaceae bacterium]
MKKVILLLATICIVVSSYAAISLEAPPLRAGEVYIVVGKNGEKVSLLELSRMKASDVQELTGNKMKFFDKVGFSVAQRKLRQSINSDGTFNDKRIEKMMKKSKSSDVTTGFHLGGFALGFFLTVIGVLIAYLINDEKKATRVKWAWIGFGVSLAIVIIASL